MALTTNSKILAADIAAIKQRLKLELKRRGGQGSVYGWGIILMITQSRLQRTVKF